MFSANDYVNEYHWEICLRDEKIFRYNRTEPEEEIIKLWKKKKKVYY